MTDPANVVYGRLKEAAHISGYTFARTSEWLETLLADEAWRSVGSGFTDINAFLRSIDLSPFNIGDNRPALVRRIKELQPDASERAIAAAVGQPKSTIHRDLSPAPSGAPQPGPDPVDQREHMDSAPNGAPIHEPDPEPDFDAVGHPDEDWRFVRKREEDGIEELMNGFEPEPEPEPEPAQEKPVAHVGRNSGDNEWYTPAEYIKAATAVMGGIDLDPASSQAANKVVCAAEFYTEDDDGLTQSWAGRVWMNPPYAQPFVDRFCTRVAREYRDGQVTEACVLVNNGTETNWFQEVAAQASAMCFPRGRIKFWHPDKAATPLQGQAVIYLGSHADAFKAEFLRFGFVVTL